MLSLANNSGGRDAILLSGGPKPISVARKGATSIVDPASSNLILLVIVSRQKNLENSITQRATYCKATSHVTLRLMYLTGRTSGIRVPKFNALQPIIDRYEVSEILDAEESRPSDK